MRIRPANSADIANITVLHRQAFRGFFVSEMGPLFVAAYYSQVLTSPQGILIVAEVDGKLAGCVAGFTDTKKFYQEMANSKSRFILPVIAGLMRRPLLVRRFLFNKKHVEGAQLNAIGDVGCCELSSVGVAPGMMGKGIGTILLKSFVDRARALGMQSVMLTTDANDNVSVNNFYLRNGFVLNRGFLSGANRMMNEYRHWF